MEILMSTDAMVRRLEIVWNQMFGDLTHVRRNAYIYQDSLDLRKSAEDNPDWEESRHMRAILRRRLNSHFRTFLL